MAKTFPIQTSFQVGMITSRMLARLDAEIYNRSVAQIDNFVPRFQGPVDRRPGTRRLKTIAGCKECKLFEFDVAGSQSFITAVTGDGDNMVYVLDPSNVTPQNDYMAADGRFENRQGSWVDSSTGSGEVEFGLGYGLLKGNGSGVASLDYTLALAGGNYQLRVVFDQLNEKVPVLVRLSNVSMYSSELFQTWMVGGVLEVPTFFINTSTNLYLNIRLQTDSDAEKAVESVSVWYPTAPDNEFSAPTAWEGEVLREVQAEMPPGDDVLYFTSDQTPPQKLAYNPTTRQFSFGTVSFASSPFTTSNYPRAVTFFQSRSWWGGTLDNPEQFWGSKVNSFEDLSTGAGASDAVTFSIDRRGAIQWMAGVKNLLIGTAKGEFIITAQDLVIIASDVQIDRQSAYGSRNVDPQEIGNHVIYVSPDGRKVRSMGYQWTDDGWITRDLTFFAEDITLGETVVGVTYRQNPESQLVCWTSEGRLLVCAYDRENDIYSWSTHEIPGYTIVSAIAIDRRGNSDLVIAAHDGTDLTIFYMSEVIYLDDYTLQYDSTLGQNLTTVIASHLANETVSVYADGTYRGDVTLDGSGQATLPGDAAAYIFTGRPYTSTLVTLPLSVPARSAGLAATKRYSRIGIRNIAETFPLINGQTPEERFDDEEISMPRIDNARDAFIQEVGFSQYAQLTITQARPEMTTVHGIFGEASADHD